MSQSTHLREAEAEEHLSQLGDAGLMVKTLSSSSAGVLIRQFDAAGEPIDVRAQAARIRALQDAGLTVFGAIEAVNEWLRSPHARLEGQSPADYALDDARAAQVRELIEDERTTPRDLPRSTG